jgi:hypothetical protein
MFDNPTNATRIDSCHNAGLYSLFGVIVHYLRRAMVEIRANGEISCIDERLLADSGLTRDSYVKAALRTFGEIHGSF